MVEWPLAAVADAEGGTPGQRLGEVALGARDRGRGGRALCQLRRDGGRQCAAGAVRVAGGYKLVGVLAVLVPVVEHVHRRGPLEVAALQQHELRPKLVQLRRRLLHLLHRGHGPPPQQHGGLVHVGRDDGGEWEEVRDHDGAHAVLRERVAAGGDEHGVHHQRRRAVPLQRGGHRADNVRAGEHACLHRARADVAQHAVHLLRHKRRLHREHALHALCVLGCERGDGGHAEDAVGEERLEVSLDAGTPARVGAGDGQGARHVWAPGGRGCLAARRW
mmetsp:Transcript_1702/g.4422  ORF Transcript_1702/g.4422 Transcript_1702/m.4422 type:complete len:276 (-) Transcript_1702:42-869(-)